MGCVWSSSSEDQVVHTKRGRERPAANHSAPGTTAAVLPPPGCGGRDDGRDDGGGASLLGPTPGRRLTPPIPIRRRGAYERLSVIPEEGEDMPTALLRGCSGSEGEPVVLYSGGSPVVVFI